ncbi:MAG: hypothetical protein IT433_10645 [Phycisphaerales bacterium]|nr:hypothetical protein [Phycisphaerales bacterium]
MIEALLNRAIVVTLALAGLAQGAGAQGLGSEVISGLQLTAEQKQEIAGFAAAHSKNLSSDKATERKADRDALLANLELGKSPSAAFRVAYSEALRDALQGAMSGGRRGGVEALVIAGELASPDSAAMISAAFASKDQVIRHQAGGQSLRQMLRTVRLSPQDAVLDTQVHDLVRGLADAAVVEKDRLVLRAWAPTLAEAGRDDANRTVAYQAIEKVVKSQGAGLADRPCHPELAEAMLILIDEGMVRQLSGAGAALDTAGAKAACATSGHLLSHIVKAVRAGSLTPESRESLVKACASLQNVLTLAGPRIGNARVTMPDASAELAKGDTSGDAAFLIEAEKIIGRDGLLYRPPFSFPAGSF